MPTGMYSESLIKKKRDVSLILTKYNTDRQIETERDEQIEKDRNRLRKKEMNKLRARFEQRQIDINTGKESESQMKV